MAEHDRSDAKAALEDATRRERQTRAASGWWPAYMLAMGVLAFALIVAVEVFFPSGLARFGVAAGWALAVVLLGWWAESHDAYPTKAGRRLIIAVALWFAAYLVVIGPFVRWQAGSSLGWWVLAAAVMAAPFLVGAWRERSRT